MSDEAVGGQQPERTPMPEAETVDVEPKAPVLETRPLPPAKIAPTGLTVKSRPSPAAAPTRTEEKALSSGKLTFADHGGFQRTVAQAVLGGAGGGLLAHLLSQVAASSDAMPLFVTLTATGALAAIGAKLGGWMSAVRGGAFGLLGGVLHNLSYPDWPLLAALLLGGAAAPVLAKGEPAAKAALTAAVTGALAFFGLYVAGVFQAHGVLAPLLPGPLATAAAGGAAGLFLGLGSTPRHIVPAEEPVEAAYLRVLAGGGGELQDILQRALGIYRVIRADLTLRKGGKTEAQLQARVSELSLRILRIAEQCHTIERDLGATPTRDLDDRIQALEAKASSSSDPAARATFQSAVQSLDLQRKSVAAIERGLERVLARLHANVALLEKVRFSLVHARSADAERIGGEASPLTDTIEELSRELDATSAAVGEVYGSTPKPEPA
ncbi:MAG: hypothetical protein IT384_13555 [Deltaproteobacteria bacterium]|nr:hypothetical protein [Deltaproteobacteria bacterium]